MGFETLIEGETGFFKSVGKCLINARFWDTVSWRIITPQTEQLIRTSGLSAGDKSAVRTAIASPDLLKVAAVEMDCPVDQLDETLLIRWLKGWHNGSSFCLDPWLDKNSQRSRFRAINGIPPSCSNSVATWRRSCATLLPIGRIHGISQVPDSTLMTCHGLRPRWILGSLGLSLLWFCLPQS